MVKKPLKNAGITLIELIVVLGIFSVISAILVFNYSNFRTNISIRNLAQEVGLAIRKAQAFATSVRGVDLSQTNTRNYPGFGISFQVGTPIVKNNVADEKEFILFTDIVREGDTQANNLYDAPVTGTCGTVQESNECLEKFNITSSDKISRLCTYSYGGTEDCSRTRVNVVFKRPNPDAVICIPQAASGCDTSASNLRIELESAGGIKRSVTVWNTGQISVE